MTDFQSYIPKNSHRVGKALLLQYGESVARLMMEIYPEHTWKPWKFRKTPHRFWYNLGAQLMKGDAEAKKTLSEYFTDLQNELGISDPSDWQEYVSHPDKLPQKIAKQLRWLGHLPFLLSLVYPEMGWKSAYNSTGASLSYQLISIATQLIDYSEEKV